MPSLHFPITQMSMDQNWNFLIFISFALFRKGIERDPRYSTRIAESALLKSDRIFSAGWKEFDYAFEWDYQKGFYLLNDFHEKKSSASWEHAFNSKSLSLYSYNSFSLYRENSICSRYKNCLIQLLFTHYSRYQTKVVLMHFLSHSLFGVIVLPFHISFAYRSRVFGPHSH